MVDSIIVVGWPFGNDYVVHEPALLERVASEIKALADFFACPAEEEEYKLFVVSPGYALIPKVLLPSNTIVIPDEPLRVFCHSHDIEKADPSTIPSYQSAILLSTYTNVFRLNNVDTTGEKMVFFICVDKRLARCAFELVAITKSMAHPLPSRRFATTHVKSGSEEFKQSSVGFIAKAAERLEEVYVDTLAYTCPVVHCSSSRKRYIDFFIIGVNSVRFMLRAGYHESQNLLPVPGWVFTSAWASLVISKFSLKTSMKDRPHLDDLVERSSSRKAFCDASIKILLAWAPVLTNSPLILLDSDTVSFEFWDKIEFMLRAHA
jgi:hypothetical protein